MNSKIIFSFDEIVQILLNEITAHSQTFILCDENTNTHCVRILIENVPGLENAEIIEVPSGEESKCLQIVEQVDLELLERNADRNALLLNVGGGVITDLGGVIAATYKRGIDFIHIPTSLMAQVDAAIGGKCAVDIGSSKNTFGVFQFAKEVLIYTPFLETLPEEERLSGFAEMLKHGIISDATFWTALTHIDPKNTSELALFVERSVHIKNEIVKEDPTEKNSRKKLNYGHTVGHAIESFFLENNAPLSHGKAIAWGMQIENNIAVSEQFMSQQTASEINQYLQLHFGEPKKFTALEKETLISFMRNDKKNDKGNIQMSLVSEIGKCHINCEIQEDLILQSL
jgi:3-dehydroquinate synthase